MARMVMKSGRERWWPDKYNVKTRELLDPSKTPKENLWDTIYKVTCVWLNKARVWAYSEQDMSELESETRMATYLRLRYLVRTKQYQRKYSFWVNCTRACFSVYNACITAWLRRLKPREMEVCGDEPISDSNNSETFFDSRSFNPTLITSSENWSAQKMRWQDAQMPYTKWKKLNETVDDEYMEYTESCGALGIVPVDKVTFVLTNYSDEERKIMSEEPTKGLTYRNYFRNWLAKKKALDPEWAARKKQHDREYQKKYNEKRKAERRRKKAQKKKAAT